MGIDGLHFVVKPYCLPSHVRELAGQRVGVDAWSWLHRGAVGAARELVSGEQPWLRRGYDPPYVEFCLKMTRVLQAASVTPVLVFDGCRLPAKAATNQQRRQRRAEARERAQRLLQEGREQEAQSALMQCLEVSSDMAHEVILRLRERGVEFVVAPYEADAQLAYLCSIPERDGGITAVVSEDSDLIAYGCRRILFKMDTTGHCLEFSLNRLFSGPEGAMGGNGGASTSGGGSGSSVVSFRGWTLDMLQAACVLAGCDFAPSLRGISFKTAASFVARRRTLPSVLKLLRAEKRWQLAATDEYCAAAKRAALAFKHALVFCANSAGGSCRRLTPLPELSGQEHNSASGQMVASVTSSSSSKLRGDGEGCDLSHLGAELAADVAQGIAYGYLHPHTLQPFPDSAEGAATTAGPHLPSQHEGRQQEQACHRPTSQHMRPSISSRRQLGSWLVNGAATHPEQQQHGLGPSQHAQSPLLSGGRYPQQQQHQVQDQGQSPGVADISNVVRLCANQPMAVAGWRQQGQQEGQSPMPHTQRAGNPFARPHSQQPFSSPGIAATTCPNDGESAMPAAATTAAAAGSQGNPQPEQHDSFRDCLGQAAKAQAQVVAATVAAVVVDVAAAEQQEPCSSLEDAGTAGPDHLGSTTGGNLSEQLLPPQHQRRAMQAVTNLAGQQPQSQHLSSATVVCVSSSCGAAGPALQQSPVWNRAEQYQQYGQQYQQQYQQGPKMVQPPVLGSKRKSSGDRGSSGGGKKAAGKLLAPPGQRISRFFVASAKE